MSLEIIPITEEHVEGFWIAANSVARERKFLSVLEAPPINKTKDFIMQTIQGDWPHFVAIKNRRVIGWCNIFRVQEGLNFAHLGSLGMGIVAKYRGQGIGTALITAALRKAKQMGLIRIELTVRENNTIAIALYEKMGFEKEGIHKNAICIDGVYENYVFMALLFNQ